MSAFRLPPEHVSTWPEPDHPRGGRVAVEKQGYSFHHPASAPTRVEAATGAPDMVHADLSTPSNVLVRDGAVVAVVEIGNAGSGTRAVDLTSSPPGSNRSYILASEENCSLMKRILLDPVGTSRDWFVQFILLR